MGVSKLSAKVVFFLKKRTTPLSIGPDVGNGDFQCFSYFLIATFYFVMLNNLLLHIRIIFFGFTC